MRDQTVHDVPRRPWCSDSLREQLEDLHAVALRLGCGEAAEWLRASLRPPARQPTEKGKP